MHAYTVGLCASQNHLIQLTSEIVLSAGGVGYQRNFEEPFSIYAPTIFTPALTYTYASLTLSLNVSSWSFILSLHV